jgi:hypothetical protein
MADTVTASYGLTKPEVGASEDTWGAKINANYDTLDGLLDGTTGITPNLLSGWKVAGSAITATAAELNKLDGVTATTAELNRLAGLAPTTSELNFVDGVTSPIQSQLNGKVPTSRTVSAGLALSGGGNLSGNITISANIATQGQAEAGASDIVLMTPLKTAQAVSQAIGAADWQYSSVTTPSGTAHVIANVISAGAREVEIFFDLVSLDGADSLLIQMGTSAEWELTGYLSYSVRDGAARISNTDGFGVVLGAATLSFGGTMRLFRSTGNRWLSDHVGSTFGVDRGVHGSGQKTLSGEITRLRIVPTGTNSFDGGTIQARWR